jgi:8-oxo-dGTP diphosphatase
MADPDIGAAVVTHGGQVLLIRRAVPEGTLSWQFPAGKIEPGESTEDAAVRVSWAEDRGFEPRMGSLPNRISSAAP